MSRKDKLGTFSRKGVDGVMRYYRTLLYPHHQYLLRQVAKEQELPVCTVLQQMIESAARSKGYLIRDYDELPEEEKQAYRLGTVPTPGVRKK